MTQADRLIGKLLIMHGLIDENVHFRHASRLVAALVSAGKSFDILPMPEERHSSRKSAKPASTKSNGSFNFSSLPSNPRRALSLLHPFPEPPRMFLAPADRPPAQKLTQGSDHHWPDLAGGNGLLLYIFIFVRLHTRRPPARSRRRSSHIRHPLMGDLGLSHPLARLRSVHVLVRRLVRRRRRPGPGPHPGT